MKIDNFYGKHSSGASFEKMDDDFNTPEALAASIDKQIISQYYLHSTNYIAGGQEEAVSAELKSEFQTKLESIPSELHQQILAMYAEPLKRKGEFV